MRSTILARAFTKRSGSKNFSVSEGTAKINLKSYTNNRKRSTWNDDRQHVIYVNLH